MKKILLVVLLVSVVMVVPIVAMSAEATFNPNTMFYDFNSEGTFTLWGVPEANGNGIKANPD